MTSSVSKIIASFVVLHSQNCPCADIEDISLFQKTFAEGYCVSEVLIRASVDLPRCYDAWKLPVSTCGERTGLFEALGTVDPFSKEWDETFEPLAYDLVVCLFSEIERYSSDLSHPNRILYQVFMDYDDEFRELEDEQPNE